MAGNYDETNRGVLFKNDKARNDKDPVMRGTGNFNGQDFEVTVWPKKMSSSGKVYYQLTFKEPYRREDRSESGRDYRDTTSDPVDDF